jgi:hypothetical protein
MRDPPADDRLEAKGMRVSNHCGKVVAKALVIHELAHRVKAGSAQDARRVCG